jgi:uncharacterized protein YjbI with pentapeptide repeats
MSRQKSAGPAPGPRPPELDEASLRPVDSPLDADLDLYGALVTGDHSGLRGGGEITGTLLDAVDLSGARLDPLALADVAVRRGDLSNAVWEGLTARRVAVSGARAVGWRVIVDFAEDLLVEGCRWQYGGLYLGRTRGAVLFRDCSFPGTTIRGDLSRVVFDGCDLAEAEFAADAAAGCDLRTSRLSGARGLPTLRGASITVEQTIELAHLLAVEAGFRVE